MNGVSQGFDGATLRLFERLKKTFSTDYSMGEKAVVLGVLSAVMKTVSPTGEGLQHAQAAFEDGLMAAFRLLDEKGGAS